uniref:ubiquinone/menaquinone biosynthesis methyltransferase n=1 Tax=Candidatus Cryptobacteroides bacterium TaxID=3085639 RepID=UPI004026ECE1
MPTKTKVRNMFDSIAGDYDALNHILSLDVDKIWRRKALKQIVDAPAPVQVLDLACGTGDFSIAIAKALSRSHKRVGTPIEAHAKASVKAPVEAPAKVPVEAQVTSTGFVTGDSGRPDLMTKGHVTGVDLSEGMLAVMREKVAKAGLTEMISIEEGDGENLRFPDNTFDRVTIAFGIRNFEDRPKGLREMLRVLKPGGRLVILELSRPENKIIRWFYDLYFLHILPKVGGKVSGDKAAYAYLPASVAAFPGKKEFMATMREAGFRAVTHKAFTLGICRMYTGEK